MSRQVKKIGMTGGLLHSLNKHVLGRRQITCRQILPDL